MATTVLNPSRTFIYINSRLRAYLLPKSDARFELVQHAMPGSGLEG